MKTKILLFIISSIFFSSYSQTVTLQELIIKSKCTDYTCFNDFITTKNFSYTESKELDLGTYYLYSSDAKSAPSSNKNVKTSNTAIIVFNKNKTVCAGFRTANANEYKSLLGQIKKLGFIVSETSNIENGVMVIYKSKAYPKIQIEVQTDKIGNDELGTWTSYDIEVRRFP